MARGTQLVTLISMLRAEIRDDQSQALGQNFRAPLVQVLSRTYEFLWGEKNWPPFHIMRTILLQAGQRYYNFPVDLDFEGIRHVEASIATQWYPLGYGISEREYNIFNSDAGARAYPPRSWMIHEGDQWEIWPVPSNNGSDNGDGRVRFRGHMKFVQLQADEDVCALDDQLVVLTAAAEILAGRGAKDANVKAGLAQKRFDQLGGRMNKRKVTSMVKGKGLAIFPVHPIAVVYKPSGP